MTILAAVETEEQDEHVVEIGYDLATTYDEPLVVLHVLGFENFEAHEKSLADEPTLEDVSVEDERANARAVAREIVTAALGEFDEDVIELRGELGDPEEEILSVAEEVEPRFLTLGGKRRSPVGKAIFGSTTQSVLLGAECPVVTAMTE